jgi:dCMP deaminase
MELKKRISREEYNMEVAKLTSLRSTCPKKHVGAVLLLDNRIIATGYNGVLPNYDHNKSMDENGVTHTVHAEANLIGFCAKNGIKTDGAVLYVTLSPCEKCAELLIQSGIKTVVYLEEYRDITGLYKLNNNEVEVLDYNSLT